MYLPSLKTLWLQYNQIEIILKATCKYNKNLQEINLSFNKIRKIGGALMKINPIMKGNILEDQDANGINECHKDNSVSTMFLLSTIAITTFLTSITFIIGLIFKTRNDQKKPSKETLQETYSVGNKPKKGEITEISRRGNAEPQILNHYEEICQEPDAFYTETKNNPQHDKNNFIKAAEDINLYVPRPENSLQNIYNEIIYVDSIKILDDELIHAEVSFASD